MVDGENDSALGLYRSEGFETVRIRMVWSRPVAA
jgi:ribosomal protein S18 acetylase RimI-like enzyme